MKIELNHIIEFLSLLIAVVNFRYLKGSRLFWSIPFLFFITLAELGASYYKYVLMPGTVPPISNTHIYIWVSIVETVFYSFLVFYFLKMQVFRLILVVLSSLMVCGFLFLFFFFSRYLDYYYYFLVAEGYVLTVISCFYFYEYFLSEEVDQTWIFIKPDFWIAIGILVFFAGISVVNALYYYLRNKALTIGGLALYNVIPQGLSVFLYGSMSISIILWRNQVRKSLLR